MVQPAYRGIRMTYINKIVDSHVPSSSLSRGIHVIVDWASLVFLLVRFDWRSRQHHMGSYMSLAVHVLCEYTTSSQVTCQDTAVHV